MARSKHALIVKFGQIGDVIMAIPAARLLSEQGFKIHWACGKAVLPLLEHYSWIQLIPVDDKAIFRGGLLERIGSIVRFWSAVVFHRYDFCAILYYDPRFHMLVLPLQARVKRSLSRKSRGTSFIAGRHHTDEYARILTGCTDEYRNTSLPPVRPDSLPPATWIPAKEGRRIVLAPGGTNNVLGEQALRRWPIELYVALAEQLHERNWEVVLLGGADDSWVRPFFKHLDVSDCIGVVPLPDVVTLCDACDAVITHDTGPLHLAGLSDTCLVGIFGPVDPGMRIPRRAYVVGIWGGQGFACRPCYDGHNFAPCTFNGCMYEVTPELVLRELDRLLEDRDAGRASPWRIVTPEPEGLIQLR